MSLPPYALIALILLAGAYLALVGVLLVRGRRSDARALAGSVPGCVVLFRRLLGEEREHGAGPRLTERHVAPRR
jgi:hypothetical protein